MPATIFSGSTEVKSYRSNLSLNDVTKILSVSGNPASGAGTAAPVGSIALDYTNGNTYKKTGSLDTEWSELGSGVGGINYILNPDAESGTAGWSTYADAAGAQPVDGTGGSPNVTWSRSTTTPLRGTADFNFVKDAADRQGQGVSYDISIDNADLAKVLTVSFDYEVLSGTYANGDLTVYLIQDPTGTPLVIQPAGYTILAGTVGTKLRQIATFQTDSAIKTYRLCFHVASTSASAYTLAIDNVVVGPQVVQYGAPVTDWQAYTIGITGSTSNPTKGTITRDNAWWRRVGDSVQIRYEFEQSAGGAAGSGTYYFSLPAGLSADTSKVSLLSGERSSLGAGQVYNSASGVKSVSISLATSTAIIISDTSGVVVSSASYPLSAAVRYAFFVQIPISGWSSTVQMSNDTDTRVVAAQVAGDPASASALNPIIFPTTTYDTHGSYNASTGRYTAPVPGFYRVSGFAISVTAGTSLACFVNGVSRVLVGNTDSNGEVSFTGTVQVNAGDIIDLRPGGTLDLQSGSTFCIERLSGPSQIAASETVAFNAAGTAGDTINITDSLIKFTTIQDNTHGAYSASTGLFTAPTRGRYSVSWMVNSDPVTLSTSQRFVSWLYKNGSQYRLGQRSLGTGAPISHSSYGSVQDVLLNAGETLSVYAVSSVATTADTSALTSHFSVVRVGL